MESTNMKSKTLEDWTRIKVQTGRFLKDGEVYVMWITRKSALVDLPQIADKFEGYPLVEVHYIGTTGEVLRASQCTEEGAALRLMEYGADISVVKSLERQILWN